MLVSYLANVEGMDGIHNLHSRTKLDKTNDTYQIDEIKYEKYYDMDD
jgi:hypothetical protein